MDAEPATRKSESLQVLITVVLGFVHVAFYMGMLVGPILTLLGIVIGGLEITVSRKMSATLGVLKLWLLVVGVFTTVLSIGYLALTIIAARYY